ncbi:unnamed protein product, partial [Phaeothamnion confervicola]
LALEAWGRKVGDAKVRLALERVEQAKVYYYPDGTHALLTFRFPMRNTGRQQALVINATAGLQPKGDRHSDLQPVTRLVNVSRPRKDGYWEAYVIATDDEIWCEVRMFLTAPEIRRKVQELGQLRFDLHFSYYCRQPLAYHREELLLHWTDFEEVTAAPEEATPEPPKRAPVPEDAPVYPVKTHLLMAGEDIVQICERYAIPNGKPGDIIALAETAVAIVQGRLAYCEDIKPRWLACKLNCLFGMHSSLSSPYALEMAFREVGLARMLLATTVGIAGKLVRRPGDFYRIAGRAIAAIDDCTGTLPPFDKHVVMGPARGDQVCAEIKAKTGMDVVIVDANDLGKVDIFHTSDASRNAEVVEALKPNPQGNGPEMTPLVIIRARR